MKTVEKKKRSFVTSIFFTRAENIFGLGYCLFIYLFLYLFIYFFIFIVFLILPSALQNKLEWCNLQSTHLYVGFTATTTMQPGGGPGGQQGLGVKRWLVVVVGGGGQVYSIYLFTDWLIYTQDLSLGFSWCDYIVIINPIFSIGYRQALTGNQSHRHTNTLPLSFAHRKDSRWWNIR